METLLAAYAFGSWPSWGGGPEHSAAQLTVGAVDTPVVRWAQGSTGPLEWQFSAVDDLDGDGVKEVVFGSYDHKVYCLSGADGSKKWEVLTAGSVHSSPTVSDVDGDGRPEVLVGSFDGSVYSLNLTWPTSSTS